MQLFGSGSILATQVLRGTLADVPGLPLDATPGRAGAARSRTAGSTDVSSRCRCKAS